MSGLAWPGRHRPPRRRVHDVDDAPAALVLAPGRSPSPVIRASFGCTPWPRAEPVETRLWPLSSTFVSIPQHGRTGSNSIGKRILPPWRDSGRRPRMLREHRSQAIQVWCGLNQSPLQNSIEKQSPEKSALMPYLKQRGRQEAWASSARRRLSLGLWTCPHGKASHGGKFTTRPRRLDEGVMVRLDRDPRLVACRDPRKGRSLLAPRGTSPVLFGLRGTDRSAVEQGVRDLVEAQGTEDVAAVCIFQTNQGSGDHLPPALEATVEKIHILRGGHVALETSVGTWLAFAPSDELRHLAAQLVAGDVVRGLGLVSQKEGREGLHLEALNHVSGPLRNRSRPLCPTCDVRMKSAGRNQGLRCPSCTHREPDRWVGTPVTPSGWVQPPLDRRRHLAPDLGAR